MKAIKKLSLLVFMFVLLTTANACSLPIGSEGEEVLEASGTIEAIEVTIAAEQGGQIAELWVSEGDKVQKGDQLFRIEDKLPETQLRQAESSLAIAQANYDLVASGLTDEQKQANIAAAQVEVTAAEQALDELYDKHDIALAQAQKAVAEAKQAVEDAEQRLENYRQSAPQEDIDQAYANMVLARENLDDAIEDFEEHENKPKDNLQRAAALSKKAQAQEAYDAAARRYNNLVNNGDALDIEEAQANLALAKAHLEQAEEDYETLQEGPDPDDVAMAEARLDNAQAQLVLAKADRPTAEELAVSEAEVEAAQANLEAVQVQLEKMIVSAPISGTVTTRTINVGEVIQPGLATMTISQLDQLTVTVYIPENQYGRISLGDGAELKVDSFPAQRFDAVVTRIADQAEYTPRNVQTQEERQTTVYAIELKVEDPEGKLKPGMPTDVIFSGK